MGTRHQPHSARSCELALLAVGAARQRPGWGGVSCLGVGRPGSGTLAPSTARLLRRAAGAHYPLAVDAGGVGVGTRHQHHSARSCELALCAVGTTRGRPGGAPLVCVWGVWGQVLSHPRPLILWGVLPGPTTHWLWVWGVWARRPVTSPQRALLLAGFARCGGGRRASGGGASCLGVGRTGSGALPPPTARPLGRVARARYPRAVGAVGDPSPTPQRALFGASFARCWGGTRAPGRGAPCLGVGGPGSGAVPFPPARPAGRAAVVHYPLAVLWVRWVRAWGPVNNPTVCALARWLHALSRWQEVARGRHLLPGFEASEVGRFPIPDRSSFGACGWGPLPTGCGCGRCGRGDPSSTSPRALLRAGFARCGGGTRLPGGASLALAWDVRCLALFHPRPLVLWGMRPGPTTYWLCLQGLRAWGPVTNPTARALANWLCALWGRHEGSRGGLPLPRCGASGIGLFPNPDCPSFWACGRSPLPTGSSAGDAGVGTRHQTHSARPCELSFFFALSGRHEGAQEGCLLPGTGASGVGRSPTPDRPSFGACGRGRLPTGCWCGGCGRGDPSPTSQRALLRAGFARCGNGTSSPREGTSCPGVGRLESGALPPPTARPLGRAAGAHYRLAVGTGGAGVGTCHQPHSARSCDLALRAVGAARGRPGGGAFLA